MTDYGASNKYDFDNESKWFTVPSVPLLDEHDMIDDDGNVIAHVGKDELQEIANNNQRRIHYTGDPATIILGHTSDHPNAEEKPAQGFIVNPKVGQFRNKDGQLVYALHGDYKLRHNKKHLLEQYPRRSVELWWNRKEIDPVALLGGSSPERDLGLVIRNSRTAIQLSHVSMGINGTTTVRSGANSTEKSYQGQEVIHFCRRGNYSIETYYIDDSNPTIRYSKRRSTHKANLMNRNGKKKSKYSQGMSIGSRPTRPPMTPKRPQHQEIEEISEGPEEMDEHDNGEEMPMDINLDDAGYGEGPERYDALDSDTGGNLDNYDGGSEAIPGEEGMDEDENDPVLARVFQSKQWNEMSSGIHQIKQMLSGLMGGGNEQGMPEEEGMGGEEMPPPGQGMQQAPPPGAEDMGEEEEPEEEEAPPPKKPIKMSAEGSPNTTGMPGPSSGYVPGFVKNKDKLPHDKTHTHKMSRSSEPMNRAAQRPQQTNMQREMAILKKQNHEMRLQLSRMKAQADIQQLESEGVLFGPTPEVAQKIKFSREKELTLAYLHDEDSANEGGEPDTYVADKIEEMRLCYSRRKPDPARRNTPNVASLARFSRTEADISGQRVPEVNDDDFEDKLGEVGSFEAINEFATLQSGPKGISRQDAIKFCRKKYSIR